MIGMCRPVPSSAELHGDGSHVGVGDRTQGDAGAVVGLLEDARDVRLGCPADEIDEAFDGVCSRNHHSYFLPSAQASPRPTAYPRKTVVFHFILVVAH